MSIQVSVSAVCETATYTQTVPWQLWGHVCNAVGTVYSVLITQPLRTFYFEGPFWHNQAPEEICYEMTGVEARHWTSTPENVMQCAAEMERRFHSWDRTAMTVLYFTFLTLVTIKLSRLCGSLLFGRTEDQTITRTELRHMIQMELK
jgi:hypothetical protein